MRLNLPHAVDLTYCTSIHSAETWPDTLQQIRTHLPKLKSRLCPDAPMGVGLRLASIASEELLQGDRLHQFKTFLDQHGLYVAIINGFPFGGFSRERVKDKVFAPDWAHADRLGYTRRLVAILEHLLPDDWDGSVSTIPITYKPWSQGGVQPGSLQTACESLARLVEVLVETQARTGKTIHLDIEPEPDGLLENSTDFIRFHDDVLLRHAVPELLRRGIATEARAIEALNRHIGICYDTCHFAIAYESPEAGLHALAASGIAVGRIQVSSALKVAIPKAPEERLRLRAVLEAFDEPIYLHQVVERFPSGELRTHSDLGAGLERIVDTAAEEWRIHFHVPIFMEDFGLLSSTQVNNQKTLELVARRPVTTHLEIETYTWSVLPAAYQSEVGDSIAREYDWLLSQLAGA